MLGRSCWIFVQTFSLWKFASIDALVSFLNRSISGVNNEWFWFLFALIIFDRPLSFFLKCWGLVLTVFHWSFFNQFIVCHIIKTWALLHWWFIRTNRLGCSRLFHNIGSSWILTRLIFHLFFFGWPFDRRQLRLFLAFGWFIFS